MIDTYEYNERAAIKEFDAGLPRWKAEADARNEFAAAGRLPFSGGNDARIPTA